MSHVPEPRLLDVLEGRGATDRAHVDACAQCRARLAEAQAGLALAAGAEVPEPSPVYWESLRGQVSRRVDEESERRPAFWRRVSLGQRTVFFHQSKHSRRACVDDSGNRAGCAACCL